MSSPPRGDLGFDMICRKCSKLLSPITITCNVCKLTCYCSEECKKNDWVLHARRCKPKNLWQIPNSYVDLLEIEKKDGREYFVAKKDIKRGTLVLEEAPFFFLADFDPSGMDETTTEAFLGKPPMQNFFHRHSEKIVNMKTFDLTFSWIAAKYAPWLCTVDGLSTPEWIGIDEGDVFNHVPHLFINQDSVDQISSSITDFKIENAEAYRIHHIAYRNSTTHRYHLNGLPMGKAFYNNVWRFIKTCDPNCFGVFNRGLFSIFATGDIKKGEKLTLCWDEGAQLRTCKNRKKYLFINYGVFRCNCHRCIHEEKSVSKSDDMWFQMKEDRQGEIIELIKTCANVQASIAMSSKEEKLPFCKQLLELMDSFRYFPQISFSAVLTATILDVVLNSFLDFYIFDDSLAMDFNKTISDFVKAISDPQTKAEFAFLCSFSASIRYKMLFHQVAAVFCMSGAGTDFIFSLEGANDMVKKLTEEVAIYLPPSIDKRFEMEREFFGMSENTWTDVLVFLGKLEESIQ